ncbi:2-oxoacid dehydrogenases acyltransferase-domain-containing protein [Chlamydoabsidia padenii]|nr:2-oxoacid dehydrogenases acyltransferase-domain-containing protein [Chlamydoabsidia padenii]
MNLLRLTRQPLSALIRRSSRTSSLRMLHVKGRQTTTLEKRIPATSTLLYRDFHTSLFQQATKSFLLADIGEGITECELIQWFVEPGHEVAEFDKICEVQSDKASVEITSRYAGTVTKLYHDVHGIAKVGQPLVDIKVEGDEELMDADSTYSTRDSSIKTSVTSEDLPKPTIDASKALQFPSVRRLTVTNGININDIQGTGKNGTVLKGDVIDYINNLSTQENAPKTSVKDSQDLSTTLVTSNSGTDTTASLSIIQKAMFKTMTASLAIPQLGYKDEIELDAATKYRSALNEHIAKNPTMYPFKKISYLPIFVKSLSIALSYYPIMNARIAGDPTDVNSLEIVYRDAHNVGVAMDTPQGLIVPNIKNVQSKTIFEVAAELYRLMELGKSNAIPLQDLQGGTISLSNIGTISGTYANPVIVSSELAIVALGKMQKLPRFNDDGKVVSKQILPISWSADHRIIDGATVARFGNSWKTLIENPALLTSELR